MAILPRKSSPVDPVILPLAENVDYQRYSTLRRALVAGLATRQSEIDLHMIEAELHRPSGGSSRGPRADMLRDRATRLRAAIPQKPEPPQAPDGLPPAASRAVALLQGEKVTAAQDRGARLKALRAEISEIEAGLVDITNLLAEVKAEQTTAMAERLLPSHREALRAIYEAAVAFSAAVQAEREIIVGLINAGHDGAEHILQRPGFPAASRIGTLKEHDSEISFFRRRLETLGVL